MRNWRALALACVLALSPSVLGAKKHHKPKPTPTPKPATPTPVPLLRAAGSCLSYEPGHFLLLAEVGQQGRMFRMAPETVLHVEPRRGTRIRLLYVETPDGPLAREVMAGPAATDDGP